MSKQSRWEDWYPLVAVVVALAWYFYDVAGLTGLVNYGFFVATLAFIFFLANARDLKDRSDRVLPVAVLGSGVTNNYFGVIVVSAFLIKVALPTNPNLSHISPS